MYKESLSTPEQNHNLKTRIEQKVKDVAKNVIDPAKSDADFVKNLLDLATLNKMFDSYEIAK